MTKFLTTTEATAVRNIERRLAELASKGFLTTTQLTARGNLQRRLAEIKGN